MAGVVAERIRRIRPHVVLTFGGDGGVNLHRDHTMVSVVTTAVWDATDGWQSEGQTYWGSLPIEFYNSGYAHYQSQD